MVIQTAVRWVNRAKYYAAVVVGLQPWECTSACLLKFFYGSFTRLSLSPLQCELEIAMPLQWISIALDKGSTEHTGSLLANGIGGT